MIPDECCTCSSNSNVKVADARSTSAVFLNPQRLSHRLIRFDGCVVKGEVACDWIVERTKVGRVAVELKGTDIGHAAKQIERALEFMKNHGLTDLPVGALIICSRYPSTDTTLQRIKQRLAKNHKVPLRVKTDGRDLIFDSLL